MMRRSALHLMVCGVLASTTHARGEGRGPAGAAPLQAETDYILDGGEQGEGGWEYTHLGTRLSVYSQAGRGYQAANLDGEAPGSQRAIIVQPAVQADVRQSEDVAHRLVLTVDVVSAASPNAVDVVSTASAVNHTVSATIDSTYDLTAVDQLQSVVGGGAEEILETGTAGLGYSRSLADDNTTLSGFAQATFDSIKQYDIQGYERDKGHRRALSFNLEASQLLSPTTVLSLRNGLTHQEGALDTPYNRVPTPHGIVRERFPTTRLRYAAAATLKQYIPASSATLDVDYRYYVDTLGIRAHTAELWVSQDVNSWLSISPSFRFHHQTAAHFFTTSWEDVGQRALESGLRTADSDLDEFVALRYGIAVNLIPDRRNKVELSYFYYERRDLQLSLFSLGYATSY